MKHKDLADLLRERVAVISDHQWRDRDPESHLKALKDVSMKIMGWSDSQPQQPDARLRHYLANASYENALIHLEQS